MKHFILAVSILTVSMLTAQIRSPEERVETMSDRVQRGLRGPVRLCTETSTYPGVTDADGKSYPERHSEYTTEYDTDGRILTTRSRNSDDSEWVTRNAHDPSGRLLKTATGVEGQALKETSYFYDQQGRLQKVSGDTQSDSPISFRYDDSGRKTKVEVSRAEDYRPNVAYAGSPFEALDHAPNLPGGGTATTLYDEHDRAIEIHVRDASGELVNRATRTYDAQGHVIEEKQIMENPENMFPSEIRAQMLEQSGLSADQLRQELRAQITKLMAGQSGPYSVYFRYDTHGRLNHTTRRIFNKQQEIETTYNEHGDMESEITRSTRLDAETDPTTPAPGLPAYSEVRYSYLYDQHENWVEKTTSYRPSPDGAFESSPVTKRTLTYY